MMLDVIVHVVREEHAVERERHEVGARGLERSRGVVDGAVLHDGA